MAKIKITNPNEPLTLLDASVTPLEVSDEVNILHFVQATVQVVGGNATANATIEGSLDGTNYVDLFAGAVTNGIKEIPCMVRYLRATKGNGTTPVTVLLAVGNGDTY